MPEARRAAEGRVEGLPARPAEMGWMVADMAAPETAGCAVEPLALEPAELAVDVEDWPEEEPPEPEPPKASESSWLILINCSRLFTFTS